MYPYMDMIKTKGKTIQSSTALNSSSLVNTNYLVEPEIVPSMEHIDIGKSENIEEFIHFYPDGKKNHLIKRQVSQTLRKTAAPPERPALTTTSVGYPIYSDTRMGTMGKDTLERPNSTTRKRKTKRKPLGTITNTFQLPPKPRQPLAYSKCHSQDVRSMINNLRLSDQGIERALVTAKSEATL